MRSSSLTIWNVWLVVELWQCSILLNWLVFAIEIYLYKLSRKVYDEWCYGSHWYHYQTWGEDVLSLSSPITSSWTWCPSDAQSTPNIVLSSCVRLSSRSNQVSFAINWTFSADKYPQVNFLPGRSSLVSYSSRGKSIDILLLGPFGTNTYTLQRFAVLKWRFVWYRLEFYHVEFQ